VIQIQVSEIINAIDTDQPGMSRKIRANLEDLLNQGEIFDTGYFRPPQKVGKATDKVRKSNLPRQF